MNRMDITIYVKWSCNLEHPEQKILNDLKTHPEQKILNDLKTKAEQKIENSLITFKIQYFTVPKELSMNKERRIISYMFCKKQKVSSLVEFQS